MSDLAVIVIDMLNPYDHEDADQLADHVEAAVGPLRELIASAHEADAHLIYVNDNHGDFGASRQDLVERALAGRRPDLIEPIVPPDHVDFMAKVRHSAFFSTTLDYLLRTVQGLREHGIRDRELERQAHLAAQHGLCAPL